MKKVLIITYYWPPSGGAGVQRWVKFVKYLKEFGVEPIVFIPENPHYPVLDESFNSDVPEDLKILKYPIWEPYDFYKKFIGMNRNESVQHGFIQEKKSNNFKNYISLFIRSNFFIPDARKFWIKPSIKFLTDFCLKNRPDAIISTGPPHSTHLIALGIKDKLKIPWIADFRDPWTGIDYFEQLKLTGWARKMHFNLEKKVLATADQVIAIGWNLAEELHLKGAKNVVVVTNGFDEKDFNVKEGLNINREKFVLSHIGSLNKDRNPEILWKILNKILENNKEFKDKLKINLVGKVDYAVIDSIKKYNLGDCLVRTEYLPHNEITNQYTKSDILLLLLNNTPNIKGIVTGKLFEYIASRKPVLCIGSGSGDASRVINETNSGMAFDFDEMAGIEAFIENQFNNFKNNIQSINTDTENIHKYSRKELTKELIKVVYTLTQSTSQ
jgi:glycosyltransferase involved in cell wall biosynthesis